MLTQAQIQQNANRRRLLQDKSRQTGVSLGSAFVKAMVLVFVLGAVCAFGGLPELGLTICSIGIMSLFLRWLVTRGHLAVGLLLIAFLLGYLLCWCVGFLGYCYVLPWRGFAGDIIGRHLLVTAILVLLAVCGTCLGGWAALHLVRPVRNRLLFREFPGQQVRPQLVVSGAVFLTYQVLYFSIIGFNARWDMGNDMSVGSDIYWVAGFRMPMLVAYVLLGLSLKRQFWSAWNLVVGGIVLACFGLFSLTGGRGAAFEPVVLCATGALFSPIGWRALARVCVLALPLLIASMIIIGWSRDMPAFAGGSVSDKLSAIGQTMRHGQADTSVLHDPYYLFFSRMFEPSGQLVIDDDTDSNTRMGWINFNRLPWLFVPQFLYPAKIPLQDGPERLVDFHGFAYNQFSAAPLTFLADAYERFGVAGVIGFHFAAGMILVLVGRLVFMVRWQLLSVMLIVCFAKTAETLFGASVLEFVSAVFYGFLRDAVVITSLFAVGWYLQGGRPAKTRSVPRSRAKSVVPRNSDSTEVLSKQ